MTLLRIVELAVAAIVCATALVFTGYLIIGTDRDSSD